MKIQKINIKHYRCFEEKEISFHPQFNVIIGENGSGKTAVLDAIAKFVAIGISRFAEKQEKWLTFSLSDIKKGEKKACIKCDFTTPLGIIPNITTEWETGASKWSQQLTIIDTDIEALKWAYDNKIEEIKTSNPFKRESIFLYFQVDDYLDNYSPHNNTHFGYSEVHQNIFIKQLNSIDYLENWFLKMETLENQSIIEKKDFGFKLPQLEIIRNALQKFLSILNVDSFQDLKGKTVETLAQKGTFAENPTESFLVIKNKGSELRLSQLSSGEKKMILMVAHIALRITLIPNSNAENAQGVVLIDEIDIHLHPLWQQKIAMALKQTFPHIQFIVTTHSPLIIQEMTKEEMVFLDNKSDFQPNLLTPDSILMRLQGLGDVETEERKRKVQELAQIDVKMKTLKKEGKDTPSEMQNLWADFRKIATELDWNFNL
jgi:predicted ATP-binding protein involved in virulence